jgi:hypothetical protein
VQRKEKKNTFEIPQKIPAQKIFVQAENSLPTRQASTKIFCQ